MAAPVPKEPAADSASVAPAAFVAPPRTIADITAILDSEKPDPQKIAAIKAAADAPPPVGASREKLEALEARLAMLENGEKTPAAKP